ncbi:GAF domain-containing protein [Sphaerospermopsis aphanizomenoides BCCUSP55]|uniref:GAF domain-containing protein n=1 Tax=Sphaerospermopsis aphanizomenoides TaxID=459663 RepID=UPI001908F0E7|nr:GAF domain-containing protein [Sphaerospermopsis aphanizomenoides]MBK1988250.1 GAF domain-containing protein [Sphaerospermopsis aphanizomenoides BCCUSP55]
MLALLPNINHILAFNYYIPHGHCYLWQTPLVGLHLVSDALIAIAYFSIPAMLIYFVSKRNDIPFSKVFVLFGAFIILCGTGHLLDIWTLWHPDYWVSGIERALTAFVSCYTALQMVELLPQFLALQTPEQLEVINRELQQQITERQKAEETLQTIVSGTAAVTGNEFFPALVQNLATALGVSYAIVFERVDKSLQKVRSINVWSVDHWAENFEYELINTPCKTVVQEKMLCAFPDNLQESFPGNKLIEQLGAKSYVGVPLVDINQNVIGNLCIVDIKPFFASDRHKALLQVFAARASAELQRKWAETEKRQAYEDLEVRVKERTTALIKANASLETEIKERIAAETAMRVMAEREKAINGVILRMRQTLNLESIFSVTTTELRQNLKCDRVLIYRFNPDWSGELVSESVANNWNILLPAPTNATELTQIAVNQHNCVTTQLSNSDVLSSDTYLQETQGGIYRQKNSYCCVNDIYTRNFEPCYLNLLQQLQARAYIITPIFCGKKLWGLLAAYQNGSPRQWKEAEIGIVSQISNQLGVAVQQAELFAQTQQQAEELKLAKEAADAASRAKSEFLANMSHELRTPLNAILGFTQLMQQDKSLKVDHQRYIEIINHSGEHLLALINDVLEMSKIEAGRVTLVATEFDLHKLLYSLEAMLQLKAQSKGLKLSFECDVTVPQYIKTDENKLRQVLINLLGNAIKFTDQGSVKMRIRNVTTFTEAEEHGSMGAWEYGSREETRISLPAPQTPHRPSSPPVAKPASWAGSPIPHTPHFTPSNTPSHTLCFEVEDTGYGIAPEEISELFQAFQQTRSGEKSQEGTGLGLRISQKFVQLMGGEITVRSQLGQGSCFTFYIQPSLAEEVFSSSSIPVNGVVSIAPGQNHRILIVEDNSANRLLLSQMLIQLGFEVLEAENGEEAIALWQQWQPHLIFMDMQMPVLDGYAATRQIRHQEQELTLEQRQTPTTIIALTASAFIEQRQKTLEAGCDDFLSKPFRWEEILTILSDYLQVEYIYESNSGKEIADSYPHQFDFILNDAALNIMPKEWIEELNFAAAQGNDSICLNLITQIPPEQTALIAALTKLIDNYQFDQLITLTQTFIVGDR